MDEKLQKLLEELIGKISSKEELEKVSNELFKKGVESLLNAELTRLIWVMRKDGLLWVRTPEMATQKRQ